MEIDTSEEWFCYLIKSETPNGDTSELCVVARNMTDACARFIESETEIVGYPQKMSVEEVGLVLFAPPREG